MQNQIQIQTNNFSAHNTQSTIESISPTNPLEVSNPISAIVNSSSPTAIIIAIGILLSLMIGSITKLVYVILSLINKPPK